MSKVFNLQPIEKQVTQQVGLDVHSIFMTIQGEGPFVGRPAVFIRLAGCNLQCPLCDTDYTQGRGLYSEAAILDMVIEATIGVTEQPLVVITGGEPFRQPIGRLISLLRRNRFIVQIETNGSLFQENVPWDDDDLVIVCSPKSGKLAERMIPMIDYFKYVVKAGDIDAYDGLPTHALDHPVGKRVARPPQGFPPSKIYVQPVDTQDEAENRIHLNAAILSAQRFGYTLCIQTHKIINLP